MANQPVKTLEFNVVEHGPADAPALVLLHSIATHSAMWSAQIPVWSRSFRVFAVDLPGHGSSPIEPGPDLYLRLLDALLDRYRLKRCSIVGLSLGGMIGQQFALRHPERVHSLVIANTSARLPPPMHELWESRSQEAQHNGMESQVSSTLERWFTPEFQQRAPQTVQWIAEMIRKTQPEGYSAAIAAIRGSDTLDLLPSLQSPLLVIAGGRDQATPVAALKAIAARVPHSQLHLLESAAHLSNVAEPIDFTEVVSAFLARTHSA
jgi:3-oxoadipate enol-lactonase